MAKAHLLKPFPVFIHMIFWIAYFLWIGPVNVLQYGKGHVCVMIGVMPVMLGIFYLNRYALRQLFLRGVRWKSMILSVLYFLLLLLAGYQVLYGHPNQFAKRILKAPDAPTFAFTLYFIEVAGFYWTFAYKGLGMAAAEILFNLASARFAYLKGKRKDLSEQRKRVHIRRWISHFLGNMTQSLVYGIKQGRSSAKLFESYGIIWASGIRIMARENNFFIPLDDELHHLQRLAIIYPMRSLQVQVSGDTHMVKIIPMMLLDLYKNMCKHGDFEHEQEAVFKVSCTPDRLIITNKNKIASRSAWIYERGGTGLKQLEGILHEQYAGAASMIHKAENNTFFLQIEILLTYGRV